MYLQISAVCIYPMKVLLNKYLLSKKRAYTGFFIGIMTFIEDQTDLLYQHNDE